MNKENFENYLVSIGGLIRVWRPYKGPIISAGFCQCHEGWYSIIKDAIDELITIGWNKRIVSIKEKFGALCIYIEQEDMPEGGAEIVKKYGKESTSICEMCGSSGVLREGKWIRTLCDEHSDGNKPFDVGRFNKFLNIQ